MIRQPPRSADRDDLFAAPQQSEAELAVLGSVFIRADVLDDVQLEISAADFHTPYNRVIFEHMLELRGKGRPIDPTTVIGAVRKSRGGDDVLAEVGGVTYLFRLLEVVPTSSNAVYYARLVREASILRQLQSACADTLADIRSGADAARDLLAVCEKRVFAIAEKDARGDRLAELHVTLQEALEQLERRKAGQVAGLRTGFHGLDQMTGGLRPGETTIVAGRTSMGKTALAVNIAEHAARHEGAKVLYVSLEMGRLELADRLLSSVARVDSYRMRAGHIDAQERSKLVEAANLVSSAALTIDDSPSRNVREIGAVARRMKRRKGLDLLVVDYLQLVEPDDRKAPRQEQVAAVSRRLKGLARELEIPVLCLAQLNRQTTSANENRPQLSHLRESGAIEQDADVVLFVHRPWYYENKRAERGEGEPAELIVAKQRNGPVGSTKALWFGPYVRFDNEESRVCDVDEWQPERSYGAEW